MDKQQVLAIAQRDPAVAQAVDAIEQQIGDMPITSDGLAEFIEMLEVALEHPEAWPQIRAAAIADDIADEEDLPQEFDPTIIVALLVVMYELQGRTQQQGFARGGLAQLAAAGRHGDTMLAHINPREAAMLRRAGGAGTINPRTGLPEFFSLKKVLKVALPIVLSVVAPGIGTAIGTALGATGVGATMLGGAVLGGATAGLTGGNVLKGALLGGLGGGLGNSIGSSVSEGLGLNLGTAGQGVLGNALLGAGTAAVTGGNPLKGAAYGALGTMAGNALQGVAGTGALGQGVNAGGRMFGNMLTAGFKPKDALIGGGLAGLATGVMARPGQVPAARPSQQAIDSLRVESQPLPGSEFVSKGEANPFSLEPLKYNAPQPVTSMTDPNFQGASGIDIGYKPPVPTTSMTDPNFQGADPGILSRVGQAVADNPLKALTAVTLLGGALNSAPPQVQQAVAQMSPAQQEYFNRPSQMFDWDRMQADASAAGLGLSQYMAQNWNTISGGAYNVAGGQTPPPPTRMARGGALGMMSQLMSGGGSGRDDTISAKLSDGEYVMDAETVALLGDGSNKEGARRLDEMRERLRQHKGRTLARGKFSPNAKSPLAYLKG